MHAHSQQQRLGVRRIFLLTAFLAACGGLIGCTSVSDYIRNGFKVGPNYGKPPVYVAPQWIEMSGVPERAAEQTHADLERARKNLRMAEAKAKLPEAEKALKEALAKKDAKAAALAEDAKKKAETETEPERKELRWREYLANSAGDWQNYISKTVRPGDPNIAAWWCVFDDPVLNELVQRAYGQNLTLRQAGWRILEARAQKQIAIGNIMPQTQTYNFSYQRNMLSLVRLAFIPKRYFDTFQSNDNLAWELDFWGKFRRAIESADASLDASVEDYDDVLVILLSDTARAYVEYRTLQRRLELAQLNVIEQEAMVEIMKARLKAGTKDSFPDYHQLNANLENTRSLIPQLEVLMRLANNKLCILLGLPTRDLADELPVQRGPSRYATPEEKASKYAQDTVVIPGPRRKDIVLNIPGELLLRRPDVQRAERQLAAQSAQIGIAESDMYPHISILGTVGVAASQFGKLFNSLAWFGNVGPSLSWNILNYGRILANVRFQDAKFQEQATFYQYTLLNANKEAEDALTSYLHAIVRAKDLYDSADSATKAVKYFDIQKGQGVGADYGAFINRMFTLTNFKTLQQDAAAQAEGDIALNLILLYRALGGGWQIRLGANCNDHDGEVHPIGEMLMPPAPDKMPVNMGPPTVKTMQPARFPGVDGPMLLPPGSRNVDSPRTNGKPAEAAPVAPAAPKPSVARRPARKELPDREDERLMPAAYPLPPRPFSGAAIPGRVNPIISTQPPAGATETIVPVSQEPPRLDSDRQATRSPLGQPTQEAPKK